jgi:PAS domain S-box-containing protein
MEGVLSYANDRYCDISGFERDALMGQRPRLHSGTDNTKHFYSEVLGAVSNGSIWRGKLQGHNRQGHPFWVDATVVPLYNDVLIQDRYMLMGTDITQDQQNKAQLSEQLGLMEALLEAIPTAIYFKDSLGRYSVINSAFEKLFGLSRPQVLGKTSLDIVPSLFAQSMVEKDQSLQARGGVQVFETTYNNPQTGRVSDFRYSKALTTNEQGQITGIVGAIEDVTERNLNLHQLEEATRQAEAANRAKSNFLANMSHEIRTPMNGVIGMTELALELALDPAQRDYLSLAASSAQALMAVINDILDISKIEANRVDIESIDFSLSDVIQHSLKPVEAMARKKGLAFVLTQSPGLPDHVMGDPTRLRQVLLNLCDNAVKFTPAGHVAVHVGGAPVVGGGFDLTVAVSDTGIGIAPEQQSTVFEIFSQADASTTRQYGGSGLGLTISAKLAVLMGGGIALDSVSGQGSTFTLRLRLGMPQGVHHPAVMLAPARTQATGVVPQRPSAFQVMLVEDNPVNQILCGTILKKLGHTVALANHGREALDLFAQQPWDVILMDMQMPVMDGLEATRAIRALELPGQHTPIVAMTANAMETDRQLCLEAGMDDYLSKPFKFAHLQAILEKAVSRNFPSEA